MYQSLFLQEKVMMLFCEPEVGAGYKSDFVKFCSMCYFLQAFTQMDYQAYNNGNSNQIAQLHV
jgi:hypothetical protein